ncbi:MAG: 2-succinyl-5-enolpyruvyl-6-hydroxy-3-cyclohexene-1-carboxylic-acid synthase [Kineosporiaceae bacterium]
MVDGSRAAVPVAAAAARGLVEGLLAAGVRHVVLCPGSRSAPLAYAAHGAEAAGAWRLHVRIDERSAAFTALGVGRATGGPAAVVTTSGTAVANLLPAVLEAHHAGVPLVVLTADRPPRLRGTWANQTSDLQAGLFAGAVRHAVDAAAGDPAVAWRAVARDAVAAARGGAAAPGPVHVNVGFDEPLVPPDLGWRPRAGPPAAPPPDPGVPDGPEPLVPGDPTPLPAGPRTVVVAGDGAGATARELAESAGWPLLAEPTSAARGGPNRVGAYRLLLDGDLGAAVERAVVLGRPTLSRPVARLLARPDVAVVQVGEPWRPAPGRPVTRAAAVSAPAGVTAPRDRDWLDGWLAAGRAAESAVADVLAAERHATGVLSGPEVAAAVVAATGPGAGLVLAASNPIRDADLAAGEVRAGPVAANRGLSGIDGTLSTAAGMSLATGRLVVALVGDLAFLHDTNALLLGPGEPRPRVRAVVVNDGGGGIFGLLEHGEPRFAAVLDRLFGTPQTVDLAALCAAHGVPRTVATDGPGLATALARPVAEGVEVIEVAVRRDRERDLARRLREAVADAAQRAPKFWTHQGPPELST